MRSFLTALLMAFSNQEKRKHKNVLEKHHASAYAIIEQKPYGASLTDWSMACVFSGHCKQPDRQKAFLRS